MAVLVKPTESRSVLLGIAVRFSLCKLRVETALVLSEVNYVIAHLQEDHSDAARHQLKL